jgi:hypothetical protein
MKSSSLVEKIMFAILPNKNQVELTEEEEYQKNIIEEIFTMMQTGKPKHVIVNLLREKHKNKGYSSSHIYHLIDCAELLFGKSYEVKPAMAKALAISRYNRLLEMAEMAEDYKTARGLLNDIAKLQGADKEEEDKVHLPEIIILSTDTENIKPKIIDLDENDLQIS